MLKKRVAWKWRTMGIMSFWEGMDVRDRVIAKEPIVKFGTKKVIHIFLVIPYYAIIVIVSFPQELKATCLKVFGGSLLFILFRLGKPHLKFDMTGRPSSLPTSLSPWMPNKCWKKAPTNIMYVPIPLATPVERQYCWCFRNPGEKTTRDRFKAMTIMLGSPYQLVQDYFHQQCVFILFCKSSPLCRIIGKVFSSRFKFLM